MREERWAAARRGGGGREGERKIHTKSCIYNNNNIEFHFTYFFIGGNPNRKKWHEEKKLCLKIEF